MWWMPSNLICATPSRTHVPAMSQMSTPESVPLERRRAAACDYRTVQDGALIPRYGRARRDRSLAVLEGFHPLKHALRFGANVLDVACSDPAELERLARLLAPDLAERLRG